MLEKASENSLVPFCDCMYDAYSQRSNGITDSCFSFTFEYEEFLVLVTRIFDGMRIVNIAFPFADEQKIERTIHRECKE